MLLQQRLDDSMLTEAGAKVRLGLYTPLLTLGEPLRKITEKVEIAASDQAENREGYGLSRRIRVSRLENFSHMKRAGN
jgi:hypothetical protein